MARFKNKSAAKLEDGDLSAQPTKVGPHPTKQATYIERLEDRLLYSADVMSLPLDSQENLPTDYNAADDWSGNVARDSVAGSDSVLDADSYNTLDVLLIDESDLSEHPFVVSNAAVENPAEITVKNSVGNGLANPVVDPVADPAVNPVANDKIFSDELSIINPYSDSLIVSGTAGSSIVAATDSTTQSIVDVQSRLSDSDNPALADTALNASDLTEEIDPSDNNQLLPTLFLADDSVLSALETHALLYSEGDGAVAISDAVVVNSDTVSVATVQITNNFHSAEDALLFTDTSAISGSFNPATGILTLFGTGDSSDWQSALRSVEYQNSSNTPDLSERTVEFTLNTGQADATSVSRAILISTTGPTDIGPGLAINVDGGNGAFFRADDGGALLGGLTSLTAEGIYSIENLNSRAPLLSYYTPDSKDSLVVQLRDDGSLQFEVMLDDVITDPIPQLLDGMRHSIAMSWESAGGYLRTYVDGELVHTANDIATGKALATGGVLIIGLEQDSAGAGFNFHEVLSGTLYDIRLWNEVRSAEEISANHDHRLHSGNLPDTLIANWQFDAMSADGVVVDIVRGNNLSANIATEPGFSPSVPEDLHVIEGAANGTVIGAVISSEPTSGEDLITDGGFTTTGDTSFMLYTTGRSVGEGWVVTDGSVDIDPAWPQSPQGGVALSLVGAEPGKISQTVSTEPGKSYTLKFALSGEFNFVSEYDVQYVIDGVAASTTVTRPDQWASDNLLWTRQHSTFTATSCLLYTSPSPRDATLSRMPSSA